MNDIKGIDDAVAVGQLQKGLESSKWHAPSDAVTDAICLMDSAGRILQFNRAFLDLAGKDAAEVIGRNCWQIVHPRIGIVDTCPTHRALQKKERQNLEVRVGNRLFDITADPLLDQDGNIVAFVHSMRDITLSRQNELRFRKLNRIYRVTSGINKTILRSRQPLVIFNGACQTAVDEGGFRMAWAGLVDDATGRIEVVASAGITGNYLDKLQISIHDKHNCGPTAVGVRTGRHVICNDIEHDPMMAPWREDALRLGYRSLVALPIVMDGMVRGTVNLYADEPGFFDEEEEKLLVGMSEDIAFALEEAERDEQRRRAEESLEQTARLLAEKETRLRTLLETIPDLIWLKDKNGIYLTCNRMFERFFGAREADIIGKTDYDFVPPELADFFLEHDRKAMAKGSPSVNDEWITFADDGHRALLQTIKTPMHDADGKLIGVLGIARDITEQRKLEEQLHHVQKMESIGTLAGGIAHDFNNILTVISGFAHLTLMKMEEGDPQRPYVGQIQAAAERAAHLTKDLLLFSRKQTSERKAIDLNGTIYKMEVFLRRIIRADIDYLTDLHADALPVFADNNQLEMVLMNLATNACDAMPNGGTLSVSTALVSLGESFVKIYGYGKAGHYARISISDTGVGMDEAIRQRIFEPFFTTKEIGKGTGLGLAVVYGIIKQHEGYINVSSEQGIGTTFTVFLPIISAEGTESVSTPGQELPAGGSETILVAEDDEMVRLLTTSVLREQGYKVIDVASGAEAVRIFAEQGDTIDLVMLDLIMPSMNGSAALEEIRKLRPAIKAIFVSGYADDALRQAALLQESVPLLTKPVTPAELLQVVRNQLDWHDRAA